MAPWTSCAPVQLGATWKASKSCSALDTLTEWGRAVTSIELKPRPARVLGLVALLGAGLVLLLRVPDLGFRVMGVGLETVALWLDVFDMARRTVQADGLTRFIAVCLLAGYGWLVVGGGLALWFGNTDIGLAYDTTLHVVFVGFVFSMTFERAPVIFPSVLGVSIPYRPAFYLHVGLLHALLLRVGATLGRSLPCDGGAGGAMRLRSCSSCSLPPTRCRLQCVRRGGRGDACLSRGRARAERRSSRKS